MPNATFSVKFTSRRIASLVQTQEYWWHYRYKTIPIVHLQCVRQHTKYSLKLSNLISTTTLWGKCNFCSNITGWEHDTKKGLIISPIFNPEYLIPQSDSGACGRDYLGAE